MCVYVSHTTTQTMQHCEVQPVPVQRVPCVCPAMYNMEYIIQHTLQRRWSHLQHIAVSSFLGPHCTSAPAVRNRVCVVRASVRLCMMCVVMYVSMWEAGHGGLQKVCLPRACVCASERARWCKAAKNYMHVCECMWGKRGRLCVWVRAFVFLGLDWATPCTD